MTPLSPLGLMLADADDMKPNEYAAVLDLRPACLLVMAYAAWQNDKGVAAQTSELVRKLGHTDLYVRFHADPNPIAYATQHGGPVGWARLCAARMEQYYQPLADQGVRLHAILANEVDADYEGGLSPKQASIWYAAALTEYARQRPSDSVHVPAPTGAPETHRQYLEQYKADGWVRPDFWIDGHGYDGDLGNVCDVLEELFPDHLRAITETNDVALATAAGMVGTRAHAIFYFILNWAHGGQGRVDPPSADDQAKHMSLLRFADRYAEFKATIPEAHMPDFPRGIDVSNNNGHINWSQVATAGLSFMFAKADQGNYFVDSFLAQNWSEAKRIGLYRGAYHFADPDRVDAITSADHFLNVMTTQVQLDAGDMLALDLESGTGNLADWTLAFCQRVETVVGFKPLVYTSPGFIHDHGLASRPELGQYGLWLASWGVPTPPPAPAPWSLVAFHQTEVAPAGTIPGIAGEIDLDRFNGPADRIPLYGKPAASETPHEYVVGPGLLQKMQAVGDVPASDERFLPLWSEAWGASGTRYVFWKQTGEISLYPPAA